MECKPNERLTRSEIRKVLLRNRGAMASIAASLNVSPVTVGQVLRGRSTSKRIMDAAIAKVAELMAESAAGDAKC